MTNSNSSLEYYTNVMEINEKLKDVDHRIKMGNIKWDIESQILEGIVITILQLSKTISTHEGNVEMPNISMVCFSYFKTPCTKF